MMKFSCYVLTLALVWAAGLATAQELTAEEAAQVIARVGDEEITAGDFARDLQFRLAQMKATTGKEVQADLRIRRALMNELIQERVLSIAARNADVTVDDATLDAEFTERKDIFDSEEAYQAYLGALKLTEDELKRHMRARLRIKAFIDAETGPIEASAEEIEEYYALLKSQGTMTRTNDTRDIAVILFRAKGGTDESWRDAEERAKAARERLTAGEAFADLAKELSEDPNTAPDGGKLVEMQVGSFYPELEEAMSELSIGDVSAPVRSVMGWYLITVLEENRPGIVPLEKVADMIENQIVERERKAKIKEIVAEAQKLIRVEIVKAEDAPEDVEAAPVSQ